jgi:hypothetical protein
MMKTTGVVGSPQLPMKLRKAVVQLDGESVGFWLDDDDHPDVCPGTKVLVEFDPQDQFARIVA